MRSTNLKKPAYAAPDKSSEKLLMEKMGMSKKEIREVSMRYGVTPSKLVELMTLSKYQFVYTGRMEGQCEPCHHLAPLRSVGM